MSSRPGPGPGPLDSGDLLKSLVVVSRHNDRLARRLGRAVVEAGYSVRLVDALSELANLERPGVLLLTADGAPKEAARWARASHERLKVPLFTFYRHGKTSGRLEALGAWRRFGIRTDPDEVCEAIEVALEAHRLQTALGIVGRSSGLVRVLDEVVRVGPSNVAVLIQGETGVGKELMAHAIHHSSRRRDRQLVALNIGALTESLAESEFFGYAPGAFTGARSGGRRGYFELADQSTLFLDEIGDLPLDLQTKLLRVLDQGCFRRVGGETVIRSDVRLVVATNRDLLNLVRTGRFRPDLYYRIDIARLRIPPLRDRPGDIPLLATHFAQEVSRRDGTTPLTITPEGMDILVQHPWPGNVRELRAVVERLTLLTPAGRRPAGPEVVRKAIGDSSRASDGSRPPPPSEPGGEDVAEYQAFLHHRRVLEQVEGNVSEAARRLGIHRTTLHRRIRRWEKRGWTF